MQMYPNCILNGMILYYTRKTPALYTGIKQFQSFISFQLNIYSFYFDVSIFISRIT